MLVLVLLMAMGSWGLIASTVQAEAAGSGQTTHIANVWDTSCGGDGCVIVYPFLVNVQAFTIYSEINNHKFLDKHDVDIDIPNGACSFVTPNLPFCFGFYDPTIWYYGVYTVTPSWFDIETCFAPSTTAVRCWDSDLSIGTAYTSFSARGQATASVFWPPYFWCCFTVNKSFKTHYYTID